MGGSTALTSLAVTGTGGITLAAAATEMWTVGSQTYNSPVTLSAATKFASYRGTVTFASTLAAGANDLTVWSDEINFNGGGSSVTGTGRLVLDNFNVALSIIFGGTTDTAALDLTTSDILALSGFSVISVGTEFTAGLVAVNAGTFRAGLNLRTQDVIEVRGNITTSGTLTFNGAVTLTAASTLTSNNNAITFTSTINGAFALVINAGTSTVSFGGNVGFTDNLGREAHRCRVAGRSQFRSQWLGLPERFRRHEQPRQPRPEAAGHP